jgi:hypothetical protein
VLALPLCALALALAAEPEAAPAGAAAQATEAVQAKAAAPAAAPKIAVLRLDASGVPPELAESASALLPTEVRRHRPKSRIFSSEDVRALLTHQKERVMLGCGADAACMAELGGALGADEIVAGRLGRLGETYVLELRRVDVAQARSLGSATRTVRRADALASAAVALVAELFGAGPGPAGVAGGPSGAGGQPGQPGPPPGVVRLAFPPAAPGDERLPRPSLVKEELELRPIRYDGSNHRAVYDLVRRQLTESGLPLEREWTDDDARLRLRSQWFAVERGRRVRVEVLVDGHVGLDLDRERCGPDGCEETTELSRRELELAREIHASLRGPVEAARF